MNERGLLVCVSFTLIGSTVTVFIGLALALALGVSAITLERIMTVGAIPWFVFLRLFCHIAHNIRVRII